MSMAAVPVYQFPFEQDITKELHVHQCGHVMFTGDANSDTISVAVKKNGAAYALTGSIVGKVLRADGVLVTLGGSITGNVAKVTLNASCFTVPGPLVVLIQAATLGVKTTVLKAVYIVDVSMVETIIDPDKLVGDITDVIAALEAIEVATENANEAAEAASRISKYARLLLPANFELLEEGYCFKAESDALGPTVGDPEKAVKVEVEGWSTYCYEIGYNALIRIDKMVKNSDVSGIIPAAIRRCVAMENGEPSEFIYFSLDSDRTVQLFVGDMLIINKIESIGYAVDYLGITVLTEHEFDDIINCTDHIGEFDSIVVFGDSIFAGYMPAVVDGENTYIYGRGVTQQVAEMLGLPMENYAVAGATLTTKHTDFKPIINQVIDWTPTPGKTPLVLIDGGTNDQYNEALTNFGKYGEREIDTIYGAIFSAVEWLLTKGLQRWQIVITTPIPKGIMALVQAGAREYLDHVNTQLAAVSFAFHQIGAAMGVNVINGWHTPFGQLGDVEPKAVIMPDDVHPSEIGAAYYADYICRALGGKAAKTNERLANAAAHPFVKADVAPTGRAFLVLGQEDFTPYHLGKVLTKNGDTVDETASDEWDIYSYKYFFDMNFQLRMDSLTLNSGVENVLDEDDEGYVEDFQHLAYQRIYHNVDLDQYNTTNYPIGTADAGSYVETCALLVNRRRKDGALSIKDVGITVSVRRDFEDMIVCGGHVGEFDSLVVFGDSIFANHLSNAQGQEIDGHLTNSGVMDQLAAMMGLSQENHALGGATLSAMQRSPKSVWDQVQEWSGPTQGEKPLIMINGGTNDFRLYQLCNMGSYDHADPIEIYGGMDDILGVLIGKGIEPWQIVVVTPIPRALRATAYYTAIFDNQMTAIGYAMYQMCVKHGVSVINGYRAPFSNLESATLKASMMPDETHPSVSGAALFARHMYNIINSNSIHCIDDGDGNITIS